MYQLNIKFRPQLFKSKSIPCATFEIFGKKNYFLFQITSCVTINPLTLKIWLLILPSSCYTFRCKLVMRIWSWIKKTCTWYLPEVSLPICWIKYGNYGEKLHVDHIWELTVNIRWMTVWWSRPRPNQPPWLNRPALWRYNISLRQKDLPKCPKR